jgi:hypothetical protein
VLIPYGIVFFLIQQPWLFPVSPFPIRHHNVVPAVAFRFVYGLIRGFHDLVNIFLNILSANKKADAFTLTIVPG